MQKLQEEQDRLKKANRFSKLLKNVAHKAKFKKEIQHIKEKIQTIKEKIALKEGLLARKGFPLEITKLTDSFLGGRKRKKRKKSKNKKLRNK